MDLLPTDIEAQFTSPVCSMLFYAPDCVLFISTLAGNVSKWFLNSGEMSLSSCEMYASSVPASLVQLGDYVLVMGEKCLLANEDNLMAINLGDPLAVAAHGRDSLWVLNKQHELYLYTIKDFDSDIDVSMFRASGRPRRLLSVDDGIVAACRTTTVCCLVRTWRYLLTEKLAWYCALRFVAMFLRWPLNNKEPTHQ